MVTKEMAEAARRGEEFHFGVCTRHVGPRGGITITIEHWRVNGRCKTWKRSPERFSLPIKFGLREYAYIDEHNCHNFHRAADCPLAAAETKAAEEVLTRIFGSVTYDGGKKLVREEI